MSDKNSILFVDDDVDLCESLSLTMDTKGYDIDIATTAKQALQKVAGRWFNVALVDIGLPDMAGIDLLTKLKDTHPDMAVIMIAGYSSSENAVQSLNRGASAFIAKPVDMDELLLVVQRLIEKQQLVFENRRLLDEARQELADRKKMEDKLLEVDRLKGDFLANMSHELRTPLQSIIGFTKLLLSGRVSDPQKQDEFLKIIEGQGEHLVMLIDDLIDVQRLESGRFHVDKSDIRIDEIIADAVRELSRLASEKHIEIDMEVAASLPDVEADSMRIKQVVVNLLSNAIKFSEDGSKIWLKAAQQNGNVLVQVMDEGIGIPKAATHRIFERFHQEVPYSSEVEIDDFKERGRGKDYIEATIYVESESQKGILIGQKGQSIKDLGRQARRSIEGFLDRSVFLSLRVKVLPNWRKDSRALRRFGF